MITYTNPCYQQRFIYSYPWLYLVGLISKWCTDDLLIAYGHSLNGSYHQSTIKQRPTLKLHKKFICISQIHPNKFSSYSQRSLHYSPNLQTIMLLRMLNASTQIVTQIVSYTLNPQNSHLHEPTTYLKLATTWLPLDVWQPSTWQEREFPAIFRRYKMQNISHRQLRIQPTMPALVSPRALPRTIYCR